VETWVTIPGSAPADFKGVWFKSSGDSWNDGWGFTWRNQAGVYTIEWWCNVYTNAVVIPVTLGETLHMAGTFTAGTARAYKNGAAVGTPVGSITLTQSTNISYIAAGSTTAGSFSYFWPGTFDESAFYNTALPAGSLANHYAVGTQDLVAAPSYVPRRMPIGV
jgi:hypothetical protein